MKTAVVLIIGIVTQVAGDVFLTKGMKSLASLETASAGLSESLSQVAHLALQAAQSPSILVGTLLLIVAFALLSAALSWADLSFVLPATSFGYVLNVAAAWFFLNESVSRTRWAGAVIITLGVLFVSRSGHSTVQKRSDELLAARGAE
ncbi:MAG TPA: EamA family transporter [Blastocatellia bacterium]|jgi:drug/metabolite transporter (DMT)-like permease|nr:EamA family transporter [Blastocatellia bacterium]